MIKNRLVKILKALSQETTWYLLQTKAKQDHRAYNHLNNQSYHVYRPLLRCNKIIRGRQVTVVESLFPSYLFIQLPSTNSGWTTIESTRGVKSFVRFTSYPAVVPAIVIDNIKQLTDRDDVWDMTDSNCCGLHQGSKIYIKSGPFKGYEAIISSVNGNERATVLLNILGNKQNINLSLASLEL